MMSQHLLLASLCLTLFACGQAPETSTLSAEPSNAQPSSNTDHTELSKDEHKKLINSRIFHASFDNSINADVAQGDPSLYSASEFSKRNEAKAGLHSDSIVWRKDAGVKGGALVFERPSNNIVLFEGKQNMPYTNERMQGSVSLWLKVSPYTDLPDEFVDPIIIIDTAWNDGGIFVDFDKAESREFRLGVFSEYAFWNPDDKAYDEVPEAQRPMLGVSGQIFKPDTWTHVAFTWENINSDTNARASLFINGEYQGSLNKRKKIEWELDALKIVLGLNYVGAIDELIVLDRALSPNELNALYQKLL